MKNILINDKILDISKNHFNYLMTLENVVGVGLGYKNINKITTSEPCLHVLVEKKIDSNHITSSNLIPKTYMGIKTDVIDNGVFSACLLNIDLINKVRPLECGYCIGGGKITTGTLGCIVTKTIKKKKEYFILSNNHVLAGTNTLPIGTPIVQPSFNFTEAIDEYKIASLCDFVKLKLKNQLYFPNNYIDCAIAKIENKALIPITNKIALNNGIVRGLASNVYLDLKVKKVGYTTGLTTGKITTIGTTIDVKFPKATQPIRFKDQILSDMQNGSGDSGSLVLTESNDAIGLLFAGSKNSTVMNDIKKVLKGLKIDLYLGFNPFI